MKRRYKGGEKVTFAIDAVFGEVKLTIKKEAESLNCFIIAGAFREEANAKKQVRFLKSKVIKILRSSVRTNGNYIKLVLQASTQTRSRRNAT